MSKPLHAGAAQHTLGHAMLALVAFGSLSACGGGDSTPPASTVSSASVAATQYGSTAVISMSGTNLDSAGLSVSSTGCKNMTRSTSGALVSTASNAYYTCTVSGALSSSVLIQSNGNTIANPAFSVPEPQVTLHVSNGQGVNGDIVITLKAELVPTTVDNFLTYVHTGFYDKTIFHRIAKPINNPSQFFVMQAGGYGATVNGALPPHKTTNPSIPVETAGGNNVQWSVAMGLDASSRAASDFFINPVDNTSTLHNSFSVFGNITSGIDVAQSILAAPAVCANNQLALTIDCLPQPDVTITSATQTL